MGIVIEGLSKSFRNEIVLDDVSLSVPEGGTLVLFGPSGAGKTVLLRCIAGAVEPERGSISLLGSEMTGVEPEYRGIGMAFQNFALFPHMSAFENIASPLRANRLVEAEVESGVQSVAKLLKIDHVLSHMPRELSNGQKQRTALARALAASPGILLLDDPLRNVDAKLRFEMRLELPRLLEGQRATVIYVTQDYREAMALGNRIVVLEGGSVKQNGEPEEIYLRPANLEIAKLFGDPTINLLNVVPDKDEGGVFAQLSGHRLPLSPGLANATGRSCVLGLRPEALSFSEAEHGIPVTVETETPLNEKTVTLAKTSGGRELLISRPSRTSAPTSGKSFLSVRHDDILLFDRKSGERIAPDGVAETETGA